METSGSRPLSSLADLDQFARDFLFLLRKDSVVLLTGDLGSGKTEFVKRLLAALGVDGVGSPTFALANEYAVAAPASDAGVSGSSISGSSIASGIRSELGGRVWHFDLYRLEDMDEIETSGLWEALDQPGLVLIEWANRISEVDIPACRPRWKVHLTATDSNSGFGSGVSRSVTWRLA